MVVYPKLIVPLQIDPAIDGGRYMFGRLATRARASAFSVADVARDRFTAVVVSRMPSRVSDARGVGEVVSHVPCLRMQEVYARRWSDRDSSH
jgi:hypothetical protein